MKMTVEFTLNGQQQSLEVEPHITLMDMLRNQLDMLGTKRGCEQGDCGTCIVLVDDKTINACLFLAIRAQGKNIRTVEGLETAEGMHRLQKTFVEKGAVQCGFCTPGMLMSSINLIERNPRPTEGEVREALSGNLCRCTGYQHIVEAVLNVGQDE